MRVFLPLIFVSAGEAVVILRGASIFRSGDRVGGQRPAGYPDRFEGRSGQAVLWMIVALFVGMLAGAINVSLSLPAPAAESSPPTRPVFCMRAGVVYPAQSRRRCALRVHRHFIARHAPGSAAGVLPHLLHFAGMVCDPADALWPLPVPVAAEWRRRMRRACRQRGAVQHLRHLGLAGGVRRIAMTLLTGSGNAQVEMR